MQIYNESMCVRTLSKNGHACGLTGLGEDKKSTSPVLRSNASGPSQRLQHVLVRRGIGSSDNILAVQRGENRKLKKETCPPAWQSRDLEQRAIGIKPSLQARVSHVH